MNTVVLIPARGGSKRIPGKNYKLLGGRPLIQWTLSASETLLSTGLVSRAVVSTDDIDVATATDGYHREILLRPAKYATDDATDDAVINHFLEHYSDTDFIIYLRPTTPFRDLHTVSECIKSAYLISATRSSIRSVQRMPESAYKAYTFGPAGVLLPILYKGADLTNKPDQQCPKTFQANGVVDILFPSAPQFRRENVWGVDIHGWETAPTIELDTLEQWALAEALLTSGGVG